MKIDLDVKGKLRPVLRLLMAGGCAAALSWPLVAPANGNATVSPPQRPLKVQKSEEELKPGPAQQPMVTVPEGRGEPHGQRPPRRPVQDPVLQPRSGGGDAGEPQRLDSSSSDAPGQLLDTLLNIPGINAAANPPDTVGDIGRNHYVQMVNATQFQIFDKDGVSVFGPASFGALWPAGDVCRANTGDPIVVYDHLADRWLLSQFANPTHMCFAISQTPDPTAGTWFLYTFDVGDEFPDYPKIGVWPDGYYMSTYESDLGIYVFDRSNMLLGNAASFMRTDIPRLGAPGVRDTRILPADLDGPAPPAGTPNYFVRTVDDQQDSGNPNDRVEVWEASVDWLAMTFTFNLVDTLTPAPFQTMLCDRNGQGLRDCIPQPNIADTVDALSNRPMMQLKYRWLNDRGVMVFNQAIDVAPSLTAAHGVTLSEEVAGIRWYELRKPGANWGIHQQGTYAPQPNGFSAENQALHRWMGSSAIDRHGNIAMAYSIVNADGSNPVFPGLRYTGRQADDPLNTMPQGEKTISNGTNAQGDSDSTVEPQRWGDYSALSVDPVDDCTFWFTSHLAGAGGTGARPTRIASFRFDNCALDLAITKTASPNPALAGDRLLYTVTVTNHGPLTATDLRVQDVLPSGARYLGDTGGCVQGPVGTLTCDLGTLASGASRSFQIQVGLDSALAAATGTATLTNVATVSANETDSNPANNRVSHTTLVNERADLRLTKQCKPDGTAPAGGTGTCTILVDNLGPSDARQVEVTDTHVADGAFTISSATASPGGSCSISGGVVRCTLGTEPAGGRSTITVQFTSDAQVDVNDTATVESPTPDPDSGNNRDEGTVRFRAIADLRLSKSDAPDPVVAGTDLAYTLNVQNVGPSSASGVILRDVLPAEVRLLSATPSQGSCSGTTTPGDPLQPLTCNLGNLANGGVAQVQVRVRVHPSVRDGTVLINNASVSSADADPENGNNNATASTTVRAQADLVASKTSDAAVYKPSSRIAYTVAVRNDGPSDARAVVVTDTLPATKQALYQSDTGGCTLAGQVLTCEMGDLPVGSSRSFNLYMTVRGSRGEVTNTAVANSSTADPAGGNNTAIRVVTVGK